MSRADSVSAAAEGTAAVPSSDGGFLRRLRSQRLAVASLAFVGILILAAVLAPLYLPDPNKGNLIYAFDGFSKKHPLGLDELGRDELARLVYGTRVSVPIAALSVLIGLVVGTAVGLISGYFGGWLDGLLQRTTDILMVFPSVVLALFLVGVFGNSVSILVVAVGIGLLPKFIRLSRGLTLSAREELYVLNARAMGASSKRILFRHILPNVMAPLIALASLGMGLSILAVAGLGFLGLGVQAPTPEWGAMMGTGVHYLFSHQRLVTIPGIAIILTVLAFNLIGDGLQAALDPRGGPPKRRRPRRLAQRDIEPRSGGHPPFTLRAPVASDDQGVPDDVVLSVRSLTIAVQLPTSSLIAVNDVGFDVRRGKTLGIVGESGSGKTVTMLSILGLAESPLQIAGGSAVLNGADLLGASDPERRRQLGSAVGTIFQDPMSSFNPVLRVGGQIEEAVRNHRPDLSRSSARAKALHAMSTVGLTNLDRCYDQYPHEYSGGMLQRAMIAMAIVNDPILLVADEPTTALDATVQAQVLEALRIAQQATGAAVVLISHDLGVIAGMADDILVMYGGRVAESGPTYEVLRHPTHPYTKGLLRSTPTLSGPIKRLLPIPGQPPRLVEVRQGCPFVQRCPIGAEDPTCLGETPRLTAPSPQRRVACHHPAPLEAHAVLADEGVKS